VSGVDARWNSSSQRFAYPLMIVYVLMAITALPLVGLGVIDWLPWSRRRTLTLVTMPLFIAVAAGYGAGRIVDTALGDHVGNEVLCFSQDRQSGNYFLCVVPGACRIAWGGEAPLVTSPWGESHEPWNRPVFKGVTPRVYFPYSVPPGASAEFAALQISRAADAIFGADIPPEEIRSRYLEVREDGSAGLKAKALTIQADYPGLRQVGGGVYFPWMMAIIVVLWSLLISAYTRWLHGGVSERKRNVMGWVFIALPMLLWIADFVLEITGVSEIGTRYGFITDLAIGAGSTVAGTVAVWVGSALVAWAAYAFCARRFERAELSMKPLGKCSMP